MRIYTESLQDKIDEYEKNRRDISRNEKSEVAKTS